MIKIILIFLFIANLANAQSLMKRHYNGSINREIAELNQELFELDATVLDRTNEVEITLPNNKVITAILVIKNHILYQGKIKGYPDSSIYLTRRKNNIAADINLDFKDYEIRFVKNNIHKISQMNYAFLPEDIDDQVIPPDPIKPIMGSLIDSGAIIDVLIAYTAQARVSQGGTTAMLNLIDLAVAKTNAAYQNSLVNFRINLVGTVETAYVESGNASTDLARLASKDNNMDEILTLRDQLHADLVSLIITKDPSVCGTGYLLKGYTDSLGSYGFNVVLRSCASGNLSLAHELGHNMGAQHAKPEATYPGFYTDSYGFRWMGVNGIQYRDIMAYSPGTRVQYFSNPNVSYQGGITGSNTAYNVRAMNDVAKYIANYRISVPGPFPSPSPLPIPSPSPTPSPTPSPLPTVNIADLTITETNGSSVLAKLNITLSQPSKKYINVFWNTEDGTAIAGSDYLPKSSYVSFSPGEVLHTAQIWITPDKIKEPTEYFSVKLTDAGPYAIMGKDIGTCTILDND